MMKNESFIDYDLLKENREDQGRWHYMVLFFVMALSFLLLTFFDVFIGEGEEEKPVPTESPIVLSADSVNLTEEDYAEMEQIRVDIRKQLIEHPDPELYSEIEGRLQFGIGERPIKYYVSCIPFLSWNYEKGALAYGENLGIWAFDGKKRDGLESYDVWLLTMERDEKGKLHVTGSYTQTLDSMEKNPSARYIFIREDLWDSCFLREDGKVYDLNCGKTAHTYPHKKQCVQGAFWGKKKRFSRKRREHE